MAKYFLFILLLSNSLVTKADSTFVRTSIIGYDFKFGGIFIHGNGQQFVNAFKLGIPNENYNSYNLDQAYLDSSAHKIYTPVRLRLMTVFGSNKIHRSWLFHKSEIGVGFAFEIQNAGSIRKTFKNIKYSNVPNSNLTGTVSYAYQCEGLEINYQYSSKPFFSRFALIGGINSSAGLNTYKRYDNLYINSSYVYYDKKQSFSIPYFNAFANFGFKYNFTCELNFFAQAESGLILYGRQIGGSSRFDGFCFGLRYKVIDEQDRAQFRQSAFW